jgi:hypothetical protein
MVFPGFEFFVKDKLLPGVKSGPEGCVSDMRFITDPITRAK